MTVFVPQSGGAGLTVQSVGNDNIATPVNDNIYRGVAWSPALNLFVAVAGSGAAVNQRAMTSPDGETWTIRTLSSAFEWRSVAWSPDLALFAAVANAGTNTQRFATSPDGINWTIRTNAANRIQFTDVVYGEGLFIAVGDGVDSGPATLKVSTSPDGIVWTSRSAGTDKDLTGVAYNAGDSIFIAVATTTGGANPAQITRSLDGGITWGELNVVNVRAYQDITYSPSLGRWVIASAGATAYSDDNGLTWTQIATGNVNIPTSIEWSEELEIFLMTTNAGADPNTVLWSPDAITWNDAVQPNAFVRNRSVYVNDVGAFISVGAQSGKQVWRSCVRYISP